MFENDRFNVELAIRLLKMEMTSLHEVPASVKAFMGFLVKRKSLLSKKEFAVIAFVVHKFSGFLIQTNSLC